MNRIDTNKAIELMNSTKGQVFSAVFTKKDGTDRVMTCRTKVTKHLKGVGAKYDAKAKGLYCVFDMHKKAYRMINLNALKSLQINKNVYIVLKDSN